MPAGGVVKSSVGQILAYGKVVRPALGIAFAPDQSSEALGVKGRGGTAGSSSRVANIVDWPAFPWRQGRGMASYNRYKPKQLVYPPPRRRHHGSEFSRGRPRCQGWASGYQPGRGKAIPPSSNFLDRDILEDPCLHCDVLEDPCLLSDHLIATAFPWIMMQFGRLVLGDIIMGVNGKTIKNSSDLYRVLDSSKV